jgi:hypothetical protein
MREIEAAKVKFLKSVMYHTDWTEITVWMQERNEICLWLVIQVQKFPT